MGVRYNGGYTEISEENVISITVEVAPYYDDYTSVGDSDYSIVATGYKQTGKGNHARPYHTDVNPNRKLYGPLSDSNDVLDGDLKLEWDAFIEDCYWLIRDMGFTVLMRDPEPKSPKSRYFIMFGVDDTPYGLMVFDLRISDHSQSNGNPQFRDADKQPTVNKLKELGILDENIKVSEVTFVMENVLVGSVGKKNPNKYDTWDNAYNRVYIKKNLP